MNQEVGERDETPGTVATSSWYRHSSVSRTPTSSELHKSVYALRSGESTGQIVRALQVDGIIVSTTRTVAHSHPAELHYHDDAHLCLIVDGRDIEKRTDRSYVRTCGDLHFYHAGEPHASTVQTPTVTSALVELGTTFLSRHGVSEQQFDLAARENRNAPLLVLQMLHELHYNDAHTPLALESLALELVTYSRARFEGTPPGWVPQIAQLLDDQWNSPLRLEALAETCGTHPVTISKGFRRYFSCSLGEYRRRLMVRRSLPLIRQETLTLSEVAFACGFADQSHFTRTFRRATRFRPGDFQRL